MKKTSFWNRSSSSASSVNMKLFSLILISVVCCYLCSCDTTHYSVIVETGGQEDAGTDGKVYITLYGSKGHSRKIHLDHEGKSEFQRGETDTFDILTEDIGTVDKIRIDLDSTDESQSPDWFLISVTLEDLTREHYRLYIYSNWLQPTAEQKTVSVWMAAQTKKLHADPEYTVTVGTGDQEDAGTHGQVYITLIGTKGDWGKIHLQHEGTFEFQRGQKNAFNIKTKDIGTVHKIRIELDSAAQSHSPNWFLKGVSVSEEKENFYVWFPWNQWLTPTEEQTTVSVEIP